MTATVEINEQDAGPKGLLGPVRQTCLLASTLADPNNMSEMFLVLVFVLFATFDRRLMHFKDNYSWLIRSWQNQARKEK